VPRWDDQLRRSVRGPADQHAQLRRVWQRVCGNPVVRWWLVHVRASDDELQWSVHQHEFRPEQLRDVRPDVSGDDVVHRWGVLVPPAHIELRWTLREHEQRPDGLRHVRKRVSCDSVLHRWNVRVSTAQLAVCGALYEHELRPSQLWDVRHSLRRRPNLRVRHVPAVPVATPGRRGRREIRVSAVGGGAVVLGLVLVLAARILAITARTPARRSSLDPRVWDFRDSAVGPMRAVVLVPHRRTANERFPLLVALHGLGETLRGVERGAWGWPRDYELGASDRALRLAPLRAEAFFGFVTTARLAALNRDLARRAYRGLVVLAPFTPDVRDDLGGAAHASFERWVLDVLVPRARRELPVLPSREATGIDGVSLGGLHALWTGLAHPETFGAVGALQPAVRDRQEPVLARFSASPTRPAQRIRIVTSTADSLRADVETLDTAMSSRGIAHEFRRVEGPHDYVFNRGAGGVEMLLFHDRALRGESAP